MLPLVDWSAVWVGFFNALGLVIITVIILFILTAMVLGVYQHINEKRKK